MPSPSGQRLFLSEELSDFSFTVRDKDKSPWRFPVHTMVLASQSAVFKSMFENEFSEKETRNAFISDIRPRVMELLLGYFYKGTANLSSWLEGRELLQAAHKYQVEPLVQHCARFLGTVLTLSNVCYIYNDAILYSLATLRKVCYKLIRNGGFLVLCSKSFEVLTKEAVMEVITNRYFNVDHELMMIDALLRWALMRCCRLGLPITKANILQELESFYLSKYRNLKHVYRSIMPYFSSFTLREDPGTALEFLVSDLVLLAFSLNASAHLVALGFNLPLTKLDCVLLLYTAKFKKWKKVRGWINDEAMMMKKPCRLKAKTVYKLAMHDRSLSFQGVPGTRVETETVQTERGSITISIHCQSVYGITSISII